ncbi:MAG: hypothetical protein CM15mP51_17630 [Porticoccaceae bacterium]|nr:MAG: hypothetical protein CM15mP51_17630 [Porticoccaceae bacterium]
MKNADSHITIDMVSLMNPLTTLMIPDSAIKAKIAMSTVAIVKVDSGIITFNPHIHI